MTDILTQGRAAKALLEDETFQDVMAELRAGIMNTWRNTAAGSVGLREQSFFEISGLDAIEGLLRTRVEQADAELRRREKEAEAKETKARRRWA